MGALSTLEFGYWMQVLSAFTELKRRLFIRGTETEEVQKIRLEKAYNEIAMTEKFEYVLVNDNIEETAKSIIAITKAEKFRYKRLKGIEDAVIRN